MLSINPSSGPPNGPATVLGPSPGTDDDSTLPEGFAALLAGLMVPPAPPAGTLPMAAQAASPTVAPPAGDGADDALARGAVPGAIPGTIPGASPGDADQPAQDDRAGSDPRFGRPGVATESAPAVTPVQGAPATGLVGSPRGGDAGRPDPSLTTPPGVAAALAPTSSRDATPQATAMVEPTAPASASASPSVEPLAARPGAGRPALPVEVGPSIARPRARTGEAPAGLMRSPAAPADDYLAADDRLAWRGLLAVDGPATFAGAPLDAAGPADAPVAASAVRQLALAIGRAVTGDVRQLSIQLSPEELGGLEITVDFADERRVAVTIRAERPETLDLLRGETRQLERLMAQQGISLTAGGFDLGLMADGQGQRRERAGTGQGQRSAIDLRRRDDAAPTALAARPPTRPGLLNLSV